MPWGNDFHVIARIEFSGTTFCSHRKNVNNNSTLVCYVDNQEDPNRRSSC